ncbi:hypothetical protein RHSIM_Rhsim01G0137000 [Rhododendron simsii]|uniref:Retrotransposon Copia-like N-terminal domain-containing protein n=1 Tax=Rhododendron simsii TaxID=118357 RepID=A0A834LXG4_RHOSS|nr:hypothetical protein RHSIM_Rhsim01G0137000 [Rhododendron simsii]
MSSTDSNPKSQGNTPPVQHESIDNPYFLHHSDNPGQVLVSTLLNGDNYPSWQRAMIVALSAKNKFGFVDGSLPKPNDSSPKHSSWVRCNHMVLSWLLNSLDYHLRESVIFGETAAEIWANLRERFSQGNGPRLFQLQREIVNLHQDQQSVAAYHTRMKSCWDALSHLTNLPSCTCGAAKAISDLQQQFRLLQFLMGLNDSFTGVRSQMLLMEPLPSVNKAYSLLL